MYKLGYQGPTSGYQAPSSGYNLPSLSDTFQIFSYGSGPEHGHETALDLVFWAVFLVRSAPFFKPDPLERVSGPSSAGNWPKTQIKDYNFYYLV